MDSTNKNVEYSTPEELCEAISSSDKEWTVFVDALDKLIQNNIGVISLTVMNLPTDWKAHLSV